MMRWVIRGWIIWAVFLWLVTYVAFYDYVPCGGLTPC